MKTNFYFWHRMEGIYLLLGTNLGDREANLAQARTELEARVGDIVVASPLYATAAWGITEQPDFLNQVLCIDTHLAPELLLQTLLQIEADMGRVRKVKWGERLIDLDILYYHNQVIQQERLTIPHPGIPNRRFTLIPLVDIAPQGIHPVLGLSQLALLQQCPDPLEVHPHPTKEA